MLPKYMSLQNFFKPLVGFKLIRGFFY